MHDEAAGEVQHAGLTEEAAAPYPMRQRHIDNEQPQHAEPYERREAQTVSDRARDQRDGDDGEGHLVDHEQALGDRLRQRRDRFHADIHQEHAREVAEPGAVAAEGERIADHRPEQRHDEGRGKRLRHRGEHVLLAHHAGVKQRKTRDRHHQDEGGRRDHPGGVAAVDLGRCLRVKRCRPQRCGHGRNCACRARKRLDHR